MEWLASTTSRQEEPVNVQATLLALTARTIAQEIDKLTQRDCEVLVCGGGAYNTHLMHTLQTLLPKTTVSSTLIVGIAPEWIESMAFAWLAKQTMQRQTGNISAVTGASEEVILGGVYFV
jgi:anhydro-N-acetylmuramic acid kinase